jgi:hypothetical protein
MVSRRASYGAVVLFTVAAAAAWQTSSALAETIFDDTQSERVKGAVGRENIKLDLALCAPHLSKLQGADEGKALADSVEDPECRQAILRAQAAGFSKAQIVSILMGASGVPDPNPGAAPPKAAAPAP